MQKKKTCKIKDLYLNPKYGCHGREEKEDKGETIRGPAEVNANVGTEE